MLRGIEILSRISGNRDRMEKKETSTRTMKRVFSCEIKSSLREGRGDVRNTNRIVKMRAKDEKMFSFTTISKDSMIVDHMKMFIGEVLNE